MKITINKLCYLGFYILETLICMYIYMHMLFLLLLLTFRFVSVLNL